MTAKKWQGENEIKAQLRDLTEATRRLRHDLNELMRAPAKSDTRYLRPQPPPAKGEVDDRPQRTKKQR